MQQAASWWRDSLSHITPCSVWGVVAETWRGWLHVARWTQSWQARGTRPPKNYFPVFCLFRTHREDVSLATLALDIWHRKHKPGSMELPAHNEHPKTEGLALHKANYLLVGNGSLDTANLSVGHQAGTRCQTNSLGT
jgi:hypothetical protein